MHTPKPPTPAWKPWQLSPYFLTPLILTSAALAATLEALIQLSNRTYSEQTLRTAWLSWYCASPTPSQTCLSTLPFTTFPPFEPPPAAKTGFLTIAPTTTLSPATTFAWLYLPTLLAVLYALLWQLVDDEVKRIEPFYQASLPGGARASQTVFASYISIPPVLVPLQAVRWRQWAVLLSSVVYVLVGFVTPVLQTQMFQLQGQVVQVGYEEEDGGWEVLGREGFRWEPRGGDGPVVGRFMEEAEGDGVVRTVVYADPVFARAQEGVLWAATGLGVWLLWVTMRRQTGLRNDTKGLAALVSLAAAQPGFLEGIATTVVGEGAKDAEEVLKGTVVHLGGGGGTGGEGGSSYGLCFAPPSGPPRPRNGFLRGLKKAAKLLVRCVFCGPITHHRVLRSAVGLTTIGNLFLVVFILLTGGTEKPSSSIDEAFQKTLQASSQTSDSMILAFTELFVAAIVKTLWVVAEAQTTVLTPYRSLHTQPRKAWPLLERDYTAIVPGLRTVRAFQDGQHFLGCVTTISLLLEIGLLCFGITTSMSQGTAYNADAIWVVHWIAFTVCGIIIMFVAVTNRIWLSKFPYMENNPDTIVGKLGYVCKSPGLVEDVRPVVVMTDEERRVYLKSLEGLYAFGVLQDGVSGIGRVY
ncbi:uncharacterized protein C8A04DRAFT_33480 [Dichotomopilus funicola]|uniref:Uncharacterized protein n=1 Tax=Dichotomopilus funicola TaxID=1934379 RepID=A0AAN6UTR7_9PEZI|nr:hypothetical protein C8A04DRAFT_33480 [Dichotomopilus funicola]